MADNFIYKPVLPSVSLIPGGIAPGKIIRIQGKIVDNPNRFYIDLVTGVNSEYSDVGLHFNARFRPTQIVRNSKTSSGWGLEESHGPNFPFVAAEVFEVLLLCDQGNFKIAINGQHFTEFNHRVPVERISHLAVGGDITVSFIQFDGQSIQSDPSAPSSIPLLPYENSASGSSAPPTYTEALASAPPLLNAGNYGDGYGGSYGYPPPPNPGFVSPPYPTGMPSGAPPFPPQPYAQQPMYQPHPGSFPPMYPPPQGQYAVPPASYGGPNVGPAYGAYPPGCHQYPNPYGGGGQGGIMGSAGKLLTGLGLGAVASKLPGMRGGHHNQGHYGAYPGQPHGGRHHGSGGGGFPGGTLGAVAGLGALGLGGAYAAKKLKPKKMKKNKMLKYGLPLAGAGIGGYALSRGLHGMRRSSSSSSSSSD